MSNGLPLRVHLRGPFRVETANGSVVTPVAAKAQGVLLLLLLSPHGERERRWVQDKLWSDRGSDQGSASLRQALRQIKTALGNHAGVFSADRQRIALDLDSLELVTEGKDDLAEGLDIRDSEFEEWLSVERAAVTNRTTRDFVSEVLDKAPRRIVPPARCITIFAAQDDDPGVRWMAQLVADALTRNLRERFSHDVVRGEPTAGPSEIVISVNGYRESGPQMGVRIVIGEGDVKNQTWSGYRLVEQKGAPPVEDPIVQQLVEDACTALETSIGSQHGPGGAASQNNPDMLCRSAIRSIFSMRPEQLLVADDLLRRAYAIQPHAAFQAWRAQIRVIQDVERHPGDRKQFRAEGERFARLATEADPGNSFAFAVRANVQHFLFNDSAASLEMAERSLRLNPASPMALWSRSTARLYMGDAKLAHRDAVHGRFLANASEFRFFWDLQQSATSLVLGKLDDATRLLERVTAQCPTFRPPHRYLTALYADRGDTDKALASATSLRNLEPDFSIGRLLNDTSYPASLIRRSSALNTDLLSDLR